jgi:hypothetical protein
MSTVNDALDACYKLKQIIAFDSGNLKKIEEFLTPLEKLATPTVLASDYDGYIIEGATQHGFEAIDDNGDLFVVSGDDLIKFVKLQRGPV